MAAAADGQQRGSREAGEGQQRSNRWAQPYQKDLFHITHGRLDEARIDEVAVAAAGPLAPPPAGQIVLGDGANVDGVLGGVRVSSRRRQEVCARTFAKSLPRRTSAAGMGSAIGARRRSTVPQRRPGRSAARRARPVTRTAVRWRHWRRPPSPTTLIGRASRCVRGSVTSSA